MNRALAIRSIAFQTQSSRLVPRRAVIGASFLQTPGGIQAEMERIDSDMRVFSKELTEWLYAKGYPLNTASDALGVAGFFRATWSPFIQEWMAWYAKHNGWWGNLWWNHAPHAEEFHEQLKQLRATVRKLGMDVTSPEPLRYKGPLEAGLGINPDGFLGSLGTMLRTLFYALLFGGLAIATIMVIRR